MRHVDDIEAFLAVIRPRAADLRLEFRSPLPPSEVVRLAETFETTFNTPIPNDYFCMQRITNGLDTPWGYIDGFAGLLEMNEEYFQDFAIEADGRIAKIRVDSVPYIWLGYQGNTSQSIYDIKTGQFWQTGIGEPTHACFKAPSLAGLICHLADIPLESL